MKKKLTLFIFLFALLIPNGAFAARLWQSGCEENSATNNFEWGTSGSPTVVTSPVRSGTYACRVLNPTTGTGKYFQYQFASVDGNGAYYVRFYLYLTAGTNANTRIFNMQQLASPFAQILRIALNTDNTLTLSDEDGTVGSTAALNTAQWYQIEIKFDRTAAAGSHAVDLRIDGVSSVSSSALNWSAGIGVFSIGANLGGEAATSLDMEIDDVAFNDTTGSNQTSFPGSGKIIHLFPNATGDSQTWTRAGSDSGADWGQVDEVTPNDTTDYIQSTTLNQEDLFNVGNSGIGSSDTVNVVAVGVRWEDSSGSPTTRPTFKVEIEKAAAGTISQGSGLTQTTPAWVSHLATSGTGVRNYSLVTYADPDSAAWTQTTLDSMQLGLKITTDGTAFSNVTALWASVDYTPAVIASTVKPSLTIFGTTLFIGGSTLYIP